MNNSDIKGLVRQCGNGRPGNCLAPARPYGNKFILKQHRMFRNDGKCNFQLFVGPASR